ncbi:MAG: hypothetical protein KDC79_14345 [Cyclobacteriaceae bacterium]|nr:hypothetical protein [Cyclobacteriaceae bacterium]
MSSLNDGFDPTVIREYKSRMNEDGFLIVESEDNGEEYVNFMFAGEYKGREVIYDAVIYTLRLNHHSDLYELAEQKTSERFPEFNSMTYSVDENGDLNELSQKEEEIGMYMTELILELEEEGEVKVKEHVELDTSLEFGVGLDIGLNVEEVTSNVIAKFIKDFNSGSLELDETLYSFEMDEPEEA